jgi:hypothetical protein
MEDEIDRPEARFMVASDEDAEVMYDQYRP